ncbi:bola protein [Stachybotrys elegans]|uniref:Bola protein n=1 Tax=Stachybotrys elegans TaxID=80388 RepID=A0A8K0WYI4_9HYPO|nr:bola protein [Stachybotrys elegans]
MFTRRLPTTLRTRALLAQPLLRHQLRFTSSSSSMTPAESHIASLLQSKLSPSELLVQDVSGGCGSMYAIDIASPQFRGLSILKQQRLVNAALGDLVKQWHGVQIRTKVPEEE